MIYSLIVISETPVSFREGRSTTETATLPYIPGGALLASLVTAHQYLRNDLDQLNAFFMEESTRIGNLYPASFDDKLNPLLCNLLPVYPLPKTARTCKRFPGFLFDTEQPSQHHGGQDHLLHWALFTLSGQTNDGLLERDKVCQHQITPDHPCHETIDRFLGFYRRGKQAGQWGKPKHQEILRTRTGINRATGAVEEGILYSRSMLAEKSKFWGTISLADEQADSFKAFIEEASEAGLIRVGNNRTRGLGKIKVVELHRSQLDPTTVLAERISNFDSWLRQAAKADSIETPHALYLPISLISDAIVPDHLLRDRTHLTAAYLDETWGISEAMLIYSNSSTRRVMGWSDLWRLPKADNLAISMGSVFLFGLNNPLDDSLLQILLRMQQNGIGSRRREGFGQLLVANPFHWEVNRI